MAILRAIDRVSSAAAITAAWMFFAIGVMVTYEVVMRKAFNAPTIWVDEVTRFFQIWAVYLAAAYILKNRDLIVVELFSAKIGKTWLRLSEFLSIAIIAAFSAVAVWEGTGIVLESIAQGRATSTMLGVPKWMTEPAVPLGFGLLLVQCLAELVKLIGGADSARHQDPPHQDLPRQDLPQ